MQPTPPCPTCASPLRWLADHQQWGCDRCRVMIAPAPSFPMVPSHARPLAASLGAPRSKRTMWIAIGAGVAVVGIIAIAVASKGSSAGSTAGSATGGHSSTKHSKTASTLDSAIERTFEAMGDGDTDALIDGAGISLIKKYSDCSDDDPKRDDRESDDIKREMERLASREKGARFEILSTEERKEPKLRKAGDKAGRNCRLTTDAAMHEVKVELKVTRGGHTYPQAATVRVVEIDHHFLVVAAPKLPGCSAAIARVALLEQRLHDARNLEVSRCVDEHWSTEITDCLTEALTMSDVDTCLRKLGPGAGAATGWQLPRECLDYNRAIDRMENCAVMTESVKKIFRDGHADEVKSDAWAGRRPPAALALLPESCKNHADTINTIVDRDCPNPQ